jgi:formylglycine-generating enzyme required for sulfatase activity
MGSSKSEKDYVRTTFGKDAGDRADQEIQHEVEITRPFFLGIHEVTQDQYERVVGKNPSDFSADGKLKDAVVGKNTRRFPVENVSWEDAHEFCKQLSEMEGEKKQGRSYRLPTEAEWEYACRGGAAQSLPFGIGDGTSLSSTQANFDGNNPYGGADKGVNLQRTCEVGSYKPNGFGLYDMHGNVWEWCQDWWAPYDVTITKDPTGPKEAKENRRVLRGGSWFDAAGYFCRSANHGRNDPDLRLNLFGFRVICVVRAP